MNTIIDKVLGGDNDILRNAITIFSDTCVKHLSKRDLLSLLKTLKAEVGDACYDDELADLHLSIIGQLANKDIAKDYYDGDYDIGLPDWCVLWGEMTKQHSEKIKKWFPSIQDLDYERKIKDECLNWLKFKNIPFYDLLA